ncbi:MAG: hypothetical protein CMO61_09025 [Verrucomicrobiales bacterium]|nr:hypothetical protein [Verrucomicrobiales bacterium]
MSSKTARGNDATSEFLSVKSFSDHFYFYLERMWIILPCLIAGVILALHQHRTSPISYEASAVIQPESHLAPAAEVEIEDSVLRATTNDLVAKLKAKLSLQSLYHAVTASSDLAALLPEPSRSTNQEYEAARNLLARELLSKTSVREQYGTSILTITTTLPNADNAKSVVAGLLEELGRTNSANQAGASNANIALLNEQISELQREMALSEQSLAIYSRALEIRDEIRASESRLVEFRKEYLEKWPPLVQEKEHLSLLHEVFRKEINQITKSLPIESTYWGSLQSITSTLSDEELINFQLSNTEARQNMIARDFQSDSTLHDSLIAKAKMGDVQLDFLKGEFSIIQPAVTNYLPIKLRLPDALLRFGLGGLVVGFLFATVHGKLDNSLRRIEDVELFSGRPVYTVIPEIREKATSEEKRHSRVLQAEAHRKLQANLSISHSEAKTILVSSSLPEEGKSTVSVNLTKYLAEARPSERVLLIDLDLKRPKIAEYLGLPENRAGIYEYLQGSHPLKEVIQKTEDGYFVMTAGNVTASDPFPEEKLIGGLLASLETSFHRIIIDSPPVLAISDTLTIAHQADLLCLVYRMWKTPKQALARAIKQFDGNGIEVAGIVANAMPMKTMLGKGNYYSGYYNSGYLTYADAESKASKSGKSKNNQSTRTAHSEKHS